MNPVLNLSASSTFLLLGLVLFVMFTLGRRRRTAGLVIVGLLGILLCGAFLLTSVYHRVQVSERHRPWDWQPDAATLTPRPLRPHEDQAILIVDLDPQKLDDLDVEPAELARLALELSGLERREQSTATLQSIEQIALRSGDEKSGLPLKRVARVSRSTIDDPATTETLRVLRFKCADDDWLTELREWLHGNPETRDAFVSTTHNRDDGTLDLIIESPTARRLAAGNGTSGHGIAAETLENWERVFGELHGRDMAQAFRDEARRRDASRARRDAARAAMKDVIRGSAQLADEAITIPVDAVRDATRDVAREARAAVESARSTAESAVDSLPETPVKPEAPRAPAAAEAVASGAKAAASRPEQASPRRGALRPAWVDGPKEEKFDGGYRRVVTGGPTGSLAECQRQLDQSIGEAVDAYVDLLLVPGAARQLAVSPEYVATRIVKDKYQETLEIESLDPKLVAAETEAGAMLSLHALLEFDNRVENEVRAAWRDYRVRGRLWAAGIGSAGVLGVLGALFGYLRLDTATKGYYSGRLMLATAATILAVVAVVGGSLVALLESGIVAW